VRAFAVISVALYGRRQFVRCSRHLMARSIESQSARCAKKSRIVFASIVCNMPHFAEMTLISVNGAGADHACNSGRGDG
jgi:hypothetical protein